MLPHICDFGDRLQFEMNCYKENFRKIYQSPSVNLVDLHSHRIDKGSEFMSENTNLTSLFIKEPMGYFFKFGCVFVTDTKKLLLLNESDFKKEAMGFLRKYARGHFDNYAKEMLCNGYYKRFLHLKNAYVNIER